MLSVFYITRVNFQSNKAHVFNIAKTCEALNSTGKLKMMLVSSDNSLRSLEAYENFFRRCGVKNKFTIVSLNSISNYFFGSRWRFFNWLEIVFSNISLMRHLLSNRKTIDVIYFRDGAIILPVLFAKLLGKPIFFEIHAVLHSWHRQFPVNILARFSSGLINISQGLDYFYKKYNSNSVVSFCSASEPEIFNTTKDKNELRIKLNLPIDKTIIGYAGNLYATGNNDPYGIDDIIRSLPLLPENIIFIGVGKKSSEVKELEKLANNLKVSKRVVFLPWVTKDKVSDYILSFDILVIPSAGAQIGNSPTKMFEYLPSRRPIIAANTEAISEVLTNEKNAILVDYKNPAAWSGAILKILNNPELSQKLIVQAEKDAHLYTWEKRGKDISNFITTTIEKNDKIL